MSRLPSFRATLQRVFSNRLLKTSLARQTSAVLSQQLERAMSVMSVALIGQLLGSLALVFTLWQELEHWLLCLWGIVVLASIGASLEYFRRFLSDRERVTRIRYWLRVGTAHSVFTGLIWGFAGAVFPFLGGEEALVASLIAVLCTTLASWPFYALWLPGLTLFTLSALGPTAIVTMGGALYARQFPAVMALLAVTAVLLYSGRKINEVMLSSVLAENENRKLMQRLERERNAAESARRQAEADNERLSYFFRAANHDLRQPLQAMGIYLQLLNASKTPQTAPLVDSLTNCATSISELVEQILEVSRLRADKLVINRTLVSVPEFFAAIEKEFAPVAAASGVSFATRPLPLRIDTDPALLKRVLSNLINNAFKYAAGDGARVLLAARRLGAGRIQINVYDNGPGMTEEELSQVFRPFYRGAEGKKHEGYGLGLTIVRGICDRLGIRVSAQSRPGRGTVFRLELDAAAQGEPQGVLEEAPRRQEHSASAEPLRRRVLLLEDNLAVQHSLKVLLESWGAEVAAASFLDDGLVERMKEFRPEVLLTDYNLGDGAPSGIESLLRLSRGLGSPVPCVILTAVAEELIEAEWSRSLPASPLAEMPLVLHKPAAQEDLNLALAEAAGEGRKSREGPPEVRS